MAELPERNSWFMHRTYNEIFNKANTYTLTILKLITPIVLTEFIAVIFIQPIFAFLVWDEPYLLPFRFELSFLPVTNLLSYLPNFIFHVVVLWTQGCYILLIITIVYLVVVHVIVYLEAIQVLVGNMEEGIKARNFHQWLKTVSIEVRDVKT